jgi:hypothetical protein
MAQKSKGNFPPQPSTRAAFARFRVQARPADGAADVLAERNHQAQIGLSQAETRVVSMFKTPTARPASKSGRRLPR